MPLPSINGLPLTLGKSGQTCLTPTFKAWAGADVKGGDFGDVLTFTITTNPRRARAHATRGLAVPVGLALEQRAHITIKNPASPGMAR